MMARTSNADNVARELERLLGSTDPRGSDRRGAPLVAFDADGTLWRDDVGTLVFDFALAHEHLSDEALPALYEILSSLEGPANVSPRTANEAGRTINAHFRAGRIQEKLMAELQVWAYAGLTKAAAAVLARRALQHVDRQHLYHKRVHDLLRLARRAGAEVWIVSASPRWVVQAAVEMLGVEPERVIGGEAFSAGDVLGPRLAEPLPYGSEKLSALRRARPSGRLIAAFGDSDFDLDLLGAAELAVGIGTKKTLHDGLELLPQGVWLEDP